jgi:type III pantothenate kinase
MLGKSCINDTVICSVVPDVTGILAIDLKKITGSKPYIIGKNLAIPVKNLYRKPKQVGQDRLVNAYAGIKLFGSPLIVVDFGTAITFDVVSKNKEYMGGMIIPGLKISLNTLAQNTALLPKINLQKPSEFIGRDTKSSMLSGLVYGFAALTDDLAKRIKQKIGRHAKVIGTGGNIRLIAKFCQEINTVDPYLTLKGLLLAYNNRR